MSESDFMIPYEPITTPVSKSYYKLPAGGGVGYSLDAVGYGQSYRYEQEVRLLQICLGVRPDGIIGPKTRAAARKVWDEHHAPNPVERDMYERLKKSPFFAAGVADTVVAHPAERLRLDAQKVAKRVRDKIVERIKQHVKESHDLANQYDKDSPVGLHHINSMIALGLCADDIEKMNIEELLR